MRSKTGSKTIYITDNDMTRLEELLEVAGENVTRDNKHLEELSSELLKAEVVDSTEIPANVVTMNSQVLLLDLDTNESKSYQLVFPREANLEQNRISILAPIGTAMIGCRVGNVISWNAPAGVRRMKIAKILYQPEAAGDYHL
ncbi:MAG: nucleoside diphosphate kinase regulator [Geobacteraceae bacterium]|nr:nucleoside diphosphate kinase regulator [Geobacteraceae bacterium]